MGMPNPRGYEHIKWCQAHAVLQEQVHGQFCAYHSVVHSRGLGGNLKLEASVQADLVDAGGG